MRHGILTCLVILALSASLGMLSAPRAPVFSVRGLRPGMLEQDVKALLGPVESAETPSLPEGANEVFRTDEKVHWARFSGGTLVAFGVSNRALFIIGSSLELNGHPVAGPSSRPDEIEKILGPSDWGGSLEMDYWLYGEILVGYGKPCLYMLSDWDVNWRAQLQLGE